VRTPVLLRAALVVALTLTLSLPATASTPTTAERLREARALVVARDYVAAAAVLDAAEEEAPRAAGPVPASDLSRLWFYRGVIAWRQGLRDGAALDAWRKAAAIDPVAPPDATLLPDPQDQDAYHAIRAEVKGYTGVPVEVPSSFRVFVDGSAVEEDGEITPGPHLVQTECPDGALAGAWYVFGPAPRSWRFPCKRRPDAPVAPPPPTAVDVSAERPAPTTPAIDGAAVTQGLRIGGSAAVVGGGGLLTAAWVLERAALSDERQLRAWGAEGWSATELEALPEVRRVNALYGAGYVVLGLGAAALGASFVVPLAVAPVGEGQAVLVHGRW
jgi:hypothetical protein